MLSDEELTHTVIGCFHRVYNTLGSGFLEKVYVGALALECGKHRLRVAREVPVAVHYEGVIVATYRLDMLIEGRLVVELKAGSDNKGVFARQVFNYLRCTNLELGLFLLAGERPVVRRYMIRNGVKERLATARAG